MASNFGTIFRITTFGESHGKAVGVVIDNCPPAIDVTEADIQPQLDRRRPGQSRLSSPREESDRATILSGTENGKTLGTPIAIVVKNRDHRPKDYGEMAAIPRPSHADYTYQEKYGIRASSGGGRSSARETIGTVAAGSVAEKILRERYGIEIVAWVESAGSIAVDREKIAVENISRRQVDSNSVRCPDEAKAQEMIRYIEELKEQKNSTGGIVGCVIRAMPEFSALPTGLGEPVFDKFEARLGQAMLAIPASKAFEIGSGFAGTKMTGAEHNDLFVRKEGEAKNCGRKRVRLGTRTNNSGGIQGGISNGEPILFRVGFKPPATIGITQQTVDFSGSPALLEAGGRHDPCVVPRAVPIVEAMAALVTLDMVMLQEVRCGGLWRKE